jgi:hypothetical protein
VICEYACVVCVICVCMHVCVGCLVCLCVVYMWYVSGIYVHGGMVCV